MLKIKDDVDLKELEKFGLEYDDTYKMYSKFFRYKKEVKDPIYGNHVESFANETFIKAESRKISGGDYSCQCFMDCDTLFDLIQAGLVEKDKSE